MSDALFFDEVTRFGHPWHGLYSLATGMVTPPAGPAFAVPGLPPTGDDLNPVGFCAKLAKPGMPPATNDADDVAAGRTWLNYALLSGGYQRLYGREMGGPIYIAGDGSVWYINVNRSAATTGGVSRLSVSLDLTLFGLISDPPETVIRQSIAPPATVFNAGADISVGSLLINIDDINATGSRFILTAFYPATGGRRIIGIFEVVVSGYPPAATAVVNKLADVANNFSATTLDQTWKIAYVGYGGDVNYLTQHNSANAPGSVPANNWRSWPTAQNDSSEISILLGGRYVGGAAQVMTLYAKEHYSGSGDIAISDVVTYPGLDCTFTLTKSSSLSLVSEIRANGTAVLSQSMSITASGTLTFKLRYDLSSYHQSSSSTVYNLGGPSSSFDDIESWDYVGWNIGAGLLHYGHLGPNALGNTYGMFGAYRYSNSLYGFVDREPRLYGQALSTNVVFRGVIGALSSDSTTYAPTAFNSGQKYASEHPVTGVIARSTSPICWV